MAGADRAIKDIVSSIYKLQDLRIAVGNRVVANFLIKLGIEPGESEAKAEAKAAKLLNELRGDYKRITDGIVRLPVKAKFSGGRLITEYAEFVLCRQYFNMLEAEEEQFGLLKKYMADVPLYTEYLQHIKGVGPAIAGMLMSAIDISKARYASSLWKYCGLDVAEDGRGRGRYAEHLVPKKYVNKEGEEKDTVGITFNPWIKTKLIFVLGGCLIRAGGEYSAVYRDYKNRYTNRPDLKAREGEKGHKGHIDNMAKRVMVKRFLADLYAAWRKLEGLEVHPPYHEAKLGLYHKGQQAA